MKNEACSMQKAKAAWFLGVFILYSACCLLPFPVEAGEGEQRLALVNVSLVFEKYDKVAEVSRAIDARHQPQKKELEQRAKELLERNKGLESMYNQAQTEEAVFDMIQKLRKDQFRYERELARLNADIQKEYTKQMREVLSDIRVAVRAIAEQGHFDLVLRSPDSDNPEVSAPTPENPANPATADSRPYLSTIEPASMAELLERFNRNPVLFGTKTVDITQDVLKKVNEDYQRRIGKPAAPGAKP